MENFDLVTLSGNDPPVCAFIRRLRSIFLRAQPPLLSEEGNTLSCNSFTPSYECRGINEIPAVLDPPNSYGLLSSGPYSVTWSHQGRGKNKEAMAGVSPV